MSKAKFLLPIIALMSLSACSSNNPVSSTFDPVIDDPIFVNHSLNTPIKPFNTQHQRLKEEYVSSLNEFALDFYSVIFLLNSRKSRKSTAYFFVTQTFSLFFLQKSVYSSFFWSIFAHFYS